MTLSGLSDQEIISLYSELITELKNRSIIRTKNLLGDLGEYLAIHHYSKNPNFPNLQAAPAGTQNVDAQKFEYVVIVLFSNEFKLLKILELPWTLFLENKRWHKTMRGWNLSITKKLVESATIVFSYEAKVYDQLK